ncbi:helix-turn-helix domain-containing protein [Cerasicoccus arenae]|uniref:HTH araC/xylS-type domain-containing protein n=1 Tax=Cerasicoccus arenae TaxID=424488 RepID=A0A8J3DEG4_9BACT|nr:AraC family transcriptional regulator [Cerasicoccus arenae]MBK1856976.1 helix-turn-helix transcriptional regulator [Cerasicoccus arenae]GHB90173.1 hypothetical protein GCM10007047_01000 [Cerasicoccus arenae]
MLCYLGSGSRFYGEQPVHIQARPYWEFQAVLSGVVGMQLPGETAKLHSRQLWLTAPGHAHGWTGKSGQGARVAVFHFLSIPELVKQQLNQISCLETTLSAAQCNRLRELSENIAGSWRSPQPDMLLRHEHLLLELSLLVCGSNSEPFGRDALNRKRVNNALNWFHLNMHYNPSLNEIANAAGSSPAHLRRLFHEIMQTSPKKLFDQLRFQRAIHLMTDQSAKLESISQDCGFQSASAFSRAFKQKFGCSPEQWRGKKKLH